MTFTSSSYSKHFIKEFQSPRSIDKIHIVRPGDTLWDIGIRYGTTWQHLAAINNLRNPDLIYPGDQIKISSGGKIDVDLILRVTVYTYDYSKNTSTVYWHLYAKRKGGARGAGRANSSAKVVIGGKTVFERNNLKLDFWNTDQVGLSFGSTTINGEVGSFNVSASFTDRSNLVGNNSVSGSLETSLGANARGPRVNVNGTYRRTIAYVKVNNKWVQAIPYVKVNGKWVHGGG